MSGDFEFQNVDAFLEARGFDHRADIRSIPCSLRSAGPTLGPWMHLDAVDDLCTAQAMTNWIGTDESPFFGIFWTGNTHHPYLTGPEGSTLPSYTEDKEKNRYLAALHRSDAAIGSIIEHLRRTGVLDSTLVVITGDHGEAFGEHQMRSHGTNMFEEQMHVPLVMFNSRLSGFTASTLGGVIDIGPTILHMLGLPRLPSVDGRSLFDPYRPERLFMFSPNFRMQAGYREGRRKYIHDTVRGESAVFDLDQDPGELHNIATEAEATLIKRHLAGWLAQQRRRNEPLHAAGQANRP
jgi:arylsulfatase A-like enzyme